jgi:hypothetical protein
VTLRLTPATLVAVRGRPTLASAVSRDNDVTFAGDQDTGTAAQTRAALADTANRFSLFMFVSRLIDDTHLFYTPSLKRLLI